MTFNEILFYDGMAAALAAVVFAVIFFVMLYVWKAKLEAQYIKEYGEVSDIKDKRKK